MRFKIKDLRNIAQDCFRNGSLRKCARENAFKLLKKAQEGKVYQMDTREIIDFILYLHQECEIKTIQEEPLWVITATNRALVKEITEQEPKTKIKYKKRRPVFKWAAGLFTKAKMINRFENVQTQFADTIWLGRKFDKKDTKDQIASLAHEYFHRLIADEVGFARHAALYGASKDFRAMVEIACYVMNLLAYEHLFFQAGKEWLDAHGDAFFENYIAKKAKSMPKDYDLRTSQADVAFIMATCFKQLRKYD